MLKFSFSAICRFKAFFFKKYYRHIDKSVATLCLTNKLYLPSKLYLARKLSPFKPALKQMTEYKLCNF